MTEVNIYLSIYIAFPQIVSQFLQNQLIYSLLQLLSLSPNVNLFPEFLYQPLIFIPSLISYLLSHYIFFWEVDLFSIFLLLIITKHIDLCMHRVFRTVERR